MGIRKLLLLRVHARDVDELRIEQVTSSFKKLQSDSDGGHQTRHQISVTAERRFWTFLKENE